MEENITFDLGETFTSYDKLLEKKKKFEQSHYVQLYTSDSRTIAAAKRRVNSHVDPALRFYTLKFCCVHGGKSFKAKGKGLRRTVYAFVIFCLFITQYETCHLLLMFHPSS